MTLKLRAFISSTMLDLGNERRAVARILRKLGIEPVRAETVPPSGGTSWEVIQSELASSHLFILILGDSYGWEPDSGHGAGSGMSVTHLELDAARKRRMPVLAFMKRLAYGATKDQKRDDLRKEVSNWATGVFRQEFDWADDLEEGVFSAITNFWQDHYLRSLVPDLSSPILEYSALRIPRITTQNTTGMPHRVLLAGAGMSIAAGYPTAPLLMQLMAEDLWGGQSQSSELLSFNFSTLAGYYSTKRGDAALQRCIARALNTPQNVGPTSAHMAAVRLFSKIITTNYDELFEQACNYQRLKYRVIHPLQSPPESRPGEIDIYKLVGSVSDATTMIITDDDLARVAKSATYSQVADLIDGHHLFVVGHGLRDGNIVDLLKKRSGRMQGTYVSPHISEISQVLLYRYGFKLAHQTADDFMAQLEASEQTTTA